MTPIILPFDIELTVRPRAVMDTMAAKLSAQFVATEEAAHGTVVPFVSTLTQPPRIDEYWHGQGGIYAGVARDPDGAADYHLILAEADPAEEVDHDRALAMEAGISADGHSDFRVPEAHEGALLFANLAHRFSKEHWYWLRTQYSQGHAWVQDFHLGPQGIDPKGFSRRVRFVRRLPL